MRTAIVIGATGLVGRQLTELLLNDSRFELVRVFVRRSTGMEHGRLEEHIVDFDEPDGWKKLVHGDVLFSAMGTTLRAAGSKEGQYKVDYTYQYRTAKAAAGNNVREYVLVSAAGAAVDSAIFYSRMKGELERDIKKLPFETIHILRSGILAGSRKEVRTGEKIGISVMNALSVIPGLSKLRPVDGIEVAKAMVNASFRHVVGIHTYNMGDVPALASRVVQPMLQPGIYTI